MQLIKIVGATLLVISASTIYAAELITFQPGTTATAADVNANFTALNSDTGANATAIESISLTPGPQGVAGATGASGAAGPQGEVGAQGTAGVAGTAGSQGEIGAQGVAGPQGETGAAGATGPAGTAADATAVATNTTNISALDTRTTASEASVNIIGDFVGFKSSTNPEFIDANCSNGDNLQQVIDDAPAGAVTITVTGICDGDFLVRRDGIFLLGTGPDNTTLNGSVTFSGSTNSKVQQLTITSTDQPALTIRDSSKVDVLLTNITAVTTDPDEPLSAVVILHSYAVMGLFTNVTCTAISDCNGILVSLGGSLSNATFPPDVLGGLNVTANSDNRATALQLFGAEFISFRQVGTTTFTGVGGTGSYAMEASHNSRFSVLPKTGQVINLNGDFVSHSSSFVLSNMVHNSGDTSFGSSQLILRTDSITSQINLNGGALLVVEDVTRAATVEALHALIRVGEGATFDATINAQFNTLVSVVDNSTVDTVTTDASSEIHTADGGTVTN